MLTPPTDILMFCLMFRQPRASTLFPYTTLFRSGGDRGRGTFVGAGAAVFRGRQLASTDRKSTRLNSSHANNSYAVFCLKKKTTYGASKPPVRKRGVIIPG